ncbi:MAG: isopeptide-forming domain-containing fimbrial protein, partial [Deltaproteobacteria bacterium]|nr:isopeptide-forming domain-containing fimbrial protein [Deltaproteobacteria bacterium]
MKKKIFRENKTDLSKKSKEEKIMRKLFLTFAVLLFMAVIAAPPLMAAGTLAGTAISNQAYGEYKDANSNVMPKVYSNTVTITVYQVYGVNVDPATIASTAKNGDVIYFHVQPFNTGNGNDTQTYTYVPSGDWTPSVQFFYDVNNNHTYDAGDILLTQTSPNTYKSVNGVGAPVLISPDDDYDIMMQVTVPGSGTAADGSKSIITVTATSDRSVGTPGGTKTSTGIYTTNVLAAAIAAVKTHTPAGTPTYLKPGDVVTYTVTLTNSGGTAGTSAGVTDPLPANVTYVPGSLKVSIDGGPFVAKTDGADSDGVKYDAGTKSVIAPDGGTLTISDKNTAGHIWAVQFQATLNAGTSMGSAVVNQADITYTSGTSPPVTIKTNGDTCLVSQLAGIDLTTTATPKT